MTSTPRVDGGSDMVIGQAKDRRTMVFAYCGRHFRNCKRFLNKLTKVLEDWTAHVDAAVVSADSRERRWPISKSSAGALILAMG